MIGMVERLAKALFKAHNGCRKHATGLTWEDNAVDWEKEEYRVMARAALTELYEPTEAMVEAGERHGLHAGCWRSMINEALK